MTTYSDVGGADAQARASRGWEAYCEAARALSSGAGKATHLSQDRPHVKGSRTDAACSYE
jgi:hypothetical protein